MPVFTLLLASVSVIIPHFVIKSFLVLRKWTSKVLSGPESVFVGYKIKLGELSAMSRSEKGPRLGDLQFG